jgi:hypothetical protein
METATGTLLIGAGATAIMDFALIARKAVFGTPPPNYGLVGRWLAHMKHGKFRHDAIAASPAVKGERAIGWLAHYLTGIAFAALLVGIEGSEWMDQPTLVPALLVGIGTVAAPFLLMQPGMGAGVAACRAPRPAAARLQSLLTHAIFGFGLYAAGRAVQLISA